MKNITSNPLNHTQNVQVVGIPFEKDELINLISTIKKEREMSAIFWDTQKDLLKLEDRKNHPAYSEFYKNLVTKKLVWDAYLKQVDPLIEKLEKALNYLTK